MASQLRSRYDVVINGGGIVGFTLLNLILRSPHLNRFKVLLIEQAKKPSSFEQPSRTQKEQNEKSISTNHGESKLFSNRVSSITLASKNAFKQLGVWNSVKPYAKDIASIKVWNYDYAHKIVFKQNLSSSTENRDETNVVFSTVENDRLSYALLDNLCQHRQITNEIAWNYKLQHLNESTLDDSVELKMENKETGEELIVTADLVLGCDGYKSKVRELTQMKYRECNLNKSAVVGTVRMSENLFSSENDVAYQKFSSEKDTVAALLPLDRHFSSFVISSPNDYAAFLADCDDETFVQEFNKLLSSNELPGNAILRGAHQLANSAYDNLHGILQLLPGQFRPQANLEGIGPDEPPAIDYVISDSRASFPLVFGTTSPRMITSLSDSRPPQIALLGDSAHRVHPLAGQGLNLGIQDAIELVSQLENLAKSGERVFGDKQLLAKILKRYELKRQAFVIPMSAGILAMQDLFRLAPTRMISSLNKCEPVKRASVRVANGCL